jgi:hypothetical protein
MQDQDAAPGLGLGQRLPQFGKRMLDQGIDIALHAPRGLGRLQVQGPVENIADCLLFHAVKARPQLSSALRPNAAAAEQQQQQAFDPYRHHARTPQQLLRSVHDWLAAMAGT